MGLGSIRGKRPYTRRNECTGDFRDAWHLLSGNYFFARDSLNYSNDAARLHEYVSGRESKQVIHYNLR